MEENENHYQNIDIEMKEKYNEENLWNSYIYERSERSIT